MTDKPTTVVALRHSSFKEPKSGLAQRLITEAAAISNIYATDLAGFVIVAVDRRGRWSLGSRCDDTIIGGNMLGGLAVTAITRELMADPAAVDVLERHGFVVKPQDDEG